MNSELLFKIYNKVKVKSHADVKLPEIKPEFVTLSVKPLRKHYQINNWG